MTTVLNGTLKDDQVLQTAQARVQQLVGERCWQVKRSYGGSYTFDFGDVIASKRRPYGSYWVLTRGTHFDVADISGTLVVRYRGDDDHPAALESGLAPCVGLMVTWASIDAESGGLTLTFGDRYQLRILPDADDDEDDLVELDIGYWDMRFPDGVVLRVGPQRRITLQARGRG